MNTQLSTVLAKGDVIISSIEKEMYQSECDTLVKDLGDLIIKTNPNIEKDFKIIFFPTGKNNILNLARRQNQIPFWRVFNLPLVYYRL